MGEFFSHCVRVLYEYIRSTQYAVCNTCNLHVRGTEVHERVLFLVRSYSDGSAKGCGRGARGAGEAGDEGDER